MSDAEKQIEDIKNARIDQSRGVLIIGDEEIDLSLLAAIVNPDARVLWAFVRKGGRVQPLPFTEEKVIWIEPSDLSFADECAEAEPNGE